MSENRAKEILKGLGLAATIAGVLVFPGLAYVIDWVDKQTNNNKRGRIAFYNLKKRGMVKVEKQKNRVILRITKKGQKQLNKYKLDDFTIKKPIKWDRRWRIVMFDIPESRRQYREAVRKVLYTKGFVSVQKSVLIHPYPCKDFVDIIREDLDLKEGELYIFEAKILEGEQDLLKHFKL